MAQLDETISDGQVDHLADHEKLATKANYIYDVTDYGAVGDGATDDAAAIQSALDAAGVRNVSVEGTNPFTTSSVVYFPDGEYLISAPLEVISNTIINLHSKATRIAEHGTFSGTELIQVKGVTQGASTWASRVTVRGGSLIASSAGVACVRQNADYVVFCLFEDLSVWGDEELIFDNYTQETLFRRILSRGNPDKCLHLRGNANVVEGYWKEGGTGTSADPYFLVDDHTFPTAGSSSGNRLRNMVIEGTCSVNKPLLKLDGTYRTQLEDIWMEPGGSTNGYGIHVANSYGVQMTGSMKGFNTTTVKLLVEDSEVRVEAFDYWASDVLFADCVEIADANSTLEIGTATGRRNASAQPLSLLDAGMSIVGPVTSTTRIGTPVTGQYPSVKTTNRRGGNLVQNPSFESGIYQWSWSGGAPDTTAEFVDSEVSDGLMGHFKWSSPGGSIALYQQVVSPPPEWQGQALTFAMLVKLSGGAAGFANLYVTGAGVSHDTLNNRANMDEGWQIVSTTFTPSSTANLSYGLHLSGIDSDTHVCVDEAWLGFGADGILNNNQFGSLELGPAKAKKSLTYGSAAPTAGTHKVGDIVFDTAVTAGGTIGWVCTTAGTPGTWKTFGAVTA